MPWDELDVLLWVDDVEPLTESQRERLRALLQTDRALMREREEADTE